MSTFEHPAKTEIRMMLGTTNSIALAVEGLSDYRFYETKVDLEKVSIYDCNGRDNVIDFVKDLISTFSNQVFGICDKDFLSLKVGTHKGKNILHSDFHDIEIDAIEYTNFDSILNMLLSEEKMTKKGIAKSDAVEKIYHFASILGYIRLVNEIDSTLDISFDDMKFKLGTAYDKSFKPNLNGILNCLLRPKKNNHLLKRLSDIETKTNAQLTLKYDRREITNGHDFIFSTLEFIKLFGVGSKTKMPDLDFLNNLVLGTYNLNIFKKSKLGKKLKKLKIL